jgi:hypothetical protein
MPSAYGIPLRIHAPEAALPLKAAAARQKRVISSCLVRDGSLENCSISKWKRSVWLESLAQDFLGLAQRTRGSPTSACYALGEGAP